MSLNCTQIQSLIDRNCKSDSSSYPVADKIADMNMALDRALSLIFKACGTWQFDDSNHSDYPIIMTNLVSGRRDYSFTTDEQGNLILDIYRVMVKNQDGIYDDIYPVDQQSDNGVSSFYDGRNTTGTVTRYDKTANGIFLDAIPNYSQTNGIKVFINREASYFTTADTTKKPGFAGLFHEYVALRPSFQYAYRNGLSNTKALQSEMEKMESSLKSYYRDRSKDEAPIITTERIESI